MKKTIPLLVGLMLLLGCSNMKVSHLNSQTKRLPTNNKATILTSKIIDLDAYNNLLLIPENHFLKGQMEQIGYFKEIITPNELKIKIVSHGIEKKVPSIEDAYGIKKAAKAYKPFLWFRLHRRINLDGYYGQFILSNPKTFEDYFVAEIKLPSTPKGTGDKKVWYPLFNALIDYIEQNSKNWQKDKNTSVLITNILKNNHIIKKENRTPLAIEKLSKKNRGEPRVLELVRKKEKKNTPTDGVRGLFHTLK